MAKFIQQEMPDLNNTGKKQTYYRMDVKGICGSSSCSYRLLCHMVSSLQDDVAYRGAISQRICRQDRFLQGGHRPRTRTCLRLRHPKHPHLPLYTDEGQADSTDGNDGEGRDGESDKGDSRSGKLPPKRYNMLI